MTKIQVILFLFLVVPLASLNQQPTNLKIYSRDSRLFSAEGSSRKFARRLSKPLIGNDGRVYICSGKDLLAFETNGSIAWTTRLNHTCNSDIGPVYGGREKIYLATEENMVLKINLPKIGASEPSAEAFISFQPPDKEGKGEIIGFSVSTLVSSLFINIRGQGLFAYSTMSGHVLWSSGPVLNQFGYRQGCRKNGTDCYFTSVPVIDCCEASIYISNSEGELYSLPIRSPHFKWVRDLSSFGKTFTVTPGNNGRLFVVVPAKTLLLALDIWTGNLTWQQSIGPLSSADSTPVVDSNGWVSIGSLDGYLYSFSPSGVLKKFSKARASDSTIQTCPVLDCSGYAIYISQTQMEGKVSHTIGDSTFVTAMKPMRVVFTLFVPSTGSTYWSQSYTGEFSSSLSNSTDLQQFVLDERTLLAFFAASKTGNKLTCRSSQQKLISTCSQARPKLLKLYTENERAIFLFLVFESVILVLLAGLVRFCCVFWKKKKVQDQDLGGFLDKRRSLQLKKKSFDRTIREMRNKAGDDDTKLEMLDSLVRKREGIKRKLLTTYSLGRDEAGSRSEKSLLPLYKGEEKRSKSLSLRGAKKEGATIFHTLSDDTCSSTERSSSETSWESFHDDESEPGEGTENREEGSSGRGAFKMAIRRSPSEMGSSSRSSSLALKKRKVLS